MRVIFPVRLFHSLLSADFNRRFRHDPFLAFFDDLRRRSFLLTFGREGSIILLPIENSRSCAGKWLYNNRLSFCSREFTTLKGIRCPNCLESVIAHLYAGGLSGTYFGFYLQG